MRILLKNDFVWIYLDINFVWMYHYDTVWRFAARALKRQPGNRRRDLKMHTEEAQANSGHGEDHENDKGGEKADKHLVQINLDGNEREIEKGKYLVGTLKKLVRVPDDYELDLVINGEFKPLADDAEIKIKGGEVLVSHVRRGGSS